MEQFEYNSITVESGVVLIRKFHGRVSVTEIISSWEYLIKNKLLTENHIGVINNLIDCKLEMDKDCFRQLIEYLKKNPIFFKIKLAVICDTPEKIVFPKIGERTIKELQIKPFSTYEAAVNWVQLPYQ
jgi:hypothetical protein